MDCSGNDRSAYTPSVSSRAKRSRGIYARIVQPTNRAFASAPLKMTAERRLRLSKNPWGCIEGPEGPLIKIRRRVYVAEEQQNVASSINFCPKNERFQYLLMLKTPFFKKLMDRMKGRFFGLSFAACRKNLFRHAVTAERRLLLPSFS